MTKLTASWHSAKTVRTREKVTFFVGVMSLLFTALMFGNYPEYALYGLAPTTRLTTLQVPSHHVHRGSSYTTTHTRVLLQETGLALLPLRSMLLLQHP